MLDQLFLACAKGDPRAWDQFIYRFDRVIKLTALRIANRWGYAQLVEDLTQHVYTKLWTGREKAFGACAGEPHLKVIIANACRDYCRSVHARPDAAGCTAALEQEPSGGELVAYQAIQVQEAEACLRSKLPADTVERDIRIFYLYYLHGYTSASIARLPGIQLSASGVDSAVHRFRKILIAEWGL